MTFIAFNSYFIESYCQLYERAEPPSYPEEHLPLYTEQPTKVSHPTLFFENPEFPGIVVMRISKVMINAWELDAVCHESEYPLNFVSMFNSLWLNHI